MIGAPRRSPAVRPRARRGWMVAAILPLLGACAAAPSIRFAHLGRGDGDPEGFAALRRELGRANPGYDVEWGAALGFLAPASSSRVLFVQSVGPVAARVRGTHRAASEVSRGDLVLLRPGDQLTCTPAAAAVVFTSPVPLPDHLPTFVRPDHDPLLTDTPGGCAEEEGAYRRILLTWLEEKGPYVYHGLNAHRVRITDSFSHYHPRDGGFDEIYLVQMAPPEARVVTSEAVPRILEPDGVGRAEAAALLTEHPLAVGDLVYMPRGTMHRGLGGALVQVISLPGFVPNCEVGVDHLLRAIDERLGLAGDDALPYHAAAAAAPVVK